MSKRSSAGKYAPGDDVGNTYFSTFLSGGRNAPNPSQEREGLMLREYERIFTELAVSRFEWKGLPPEIDVRYMELTLFYQALSVFYFDHQYQRFYALRAGASGMVNMLDNPTSFTVVGNQFVGKRIAARHCVPIWANALRTPDQGLIYLYASKLASIDRSIEINALNARQPKVIEADENTRLSMVNIARQIDTGADLLMVSKDNPMGSVSVLDLGVEPNTIEKLHIVRTRLWNEAMGLLGLENANQDKKERLVAAEVDANAEQVASMKRVNLNQRQKAAEDINRKYGLDVSVDFYTEATAPALPSLGGGMDESEDDE